MTRSSSSNSITGEAGFGLVSFGCFGCFGCLGAALVFRNRFAGRRSTVGTTAARLRRRGRARGWETCRTSSSESSEMSMATWH